MSEVGGFSVFGLLGEFFSFFINGVLLFIVLYLIYKICKSRRAVETVSEPEPPLPKFKKRDFTVDELKLYDGSSKAPDGRIFIAINGKVFDVTAGRMHYGPGGPYSVFAGHDASRGLATFNISKCKEEYDDLSDLQPYEIESMIEWEMQLQEKYPCVGKLLKPGEEPTVYSDDDDGIEASKKQAESLSSSTPSARSSSNDRAKSKTA